MRLLRKISWANWLLLAALMIGLAGWTTPVWAQTPTPGKPVIIYLFWGDGCPHCAKAKPYLESLTSKYPGVILKTFEVYYNQDNQLLFMSMAQKYGLEQLAVPTIFIGSYYQVGYSEELNSSIEAMITQCLQQGCVDAGEGIIDSTNGIIGSASIPSQPSATITPVLSTTPIATEPSGNPVNPPSALNQTHTLKIPLLGTVNLDLQSVALSTVLIAFIDGFNPCSFWVLSMLLAITMHTGSRKKVLIIGLIFLTVTSLTYALFIAGLFSVLKIVSFLGWIRILVALVALFFALVNIKDYFWYKAGISFTIAEDKKSGIFRRIRAVMDASQSFWGLAGSTVVLAAGVSMVEFSCTAGFPVLWVNLLTAQNIGAASFVLLLLLYMVVYQLDAMAIFFPVVISLKAGRMEEKHGRLLKLIGGMLMLTLSIVMLVNPALMNNLGSSLIIFGSAFLATLLVLLTHRVILPKFGIRIGTEFGDKSKNANNLTKKT